MHLFPTIGSGLWSINLTVLMMTLLAGLIVFGVCRMAAANINVRRPSGLQNVFEMIIDFLMGLAKDMMGEQNAKKFLPLAFTLLLYLFVANQMGVIMNLNTEVHHPVAGVTQEQIDDAGSHASIAWFMSPTANINVTMAMAIAMVGLSHVVGLSRPKSYFKHYFEPYPAFFPIHLIDELAKFLTLGLRLFGNIFAGEVLIAILVGIPLVFGFLPLGSVPLVVWLGYSLFVGTVQAFVFTVLTMVYIGQKLPHEKH